MALNPVAPGYVSTLSYGLPDKIIDIQNDI